MLNQIYQNDLNNWEQELVAYAFLYNQQIDSKNFTQKTYASYLKMLHTLESLPMTWAASICKATLQISDSDLLPDLFIPKQG